MPLGRDGKLRLEDSLEAGRLASLECESWQKPQSEMLPEAVTAMQWYALAHTSSTQRGRAGFFLSDKKG